MTKKIVKTPPTESTPQPVKNKSQAIRDYLRDRPNAGPTEIANAIKALGMECTPGYASTIKNKEKSRGPRRSRGVEGRIINNVNVIDKDSLLQAKRLVSQLGSISRAKALLELLESVQV